MESSIVARTRAPVQGMPLPYTRVRRCIRMGGAFPVWVPWPLLCPVQKYDGHPSSHNARLFLTIKSVLS